MWGYIWELRTTATCRNAGKKRLGDRSCKSGDPGLECLKLRLLGTIQKLMTPYTPDPLRLNVALSQLLHPASSLFPTITSSESSLLSWSPLRFLCRSACVRPSYPSCSRCPTSTLICTVVSGRFLSLRFPVRIRIRTPPMPKNQPGFWLKRADSCSGTRPILYAPRQCKGRCIQARWRALSGEKPNDVVARWEWNSSGTCSPSAEFYFHLDRKSTRLNSSHSGEARMPSSA